MLYCHVGFYIAPYKERGIMFYIVTLIFFIIGGLYIFIAPHRAGSFYSPSKLYIVFIMLLYIMICTSVFDFESRPIFLAITVYALEIAFLSIVRISRLKRKKIK